MPLKPWIQWLVDNNLKFVLYLIWVIALPAFWLYYLNEAMRDAKYSIEEIKQAKKGNKQ